MLYRSDWRHSDICDYVSEGDQASVVVRFAIGLHWHVALRLFQSRSRCGDVAQPR